MKDELLDLTDSKLILNGEKEDQDAWSRKIDERVDDLKQDRSERKDVYARRRDFYQGNHGDYTNVVGLVKDTKQKKGHTNQVTNYAGKTVVKMAFGIANNPPNYTIEPEDNLDPTETSRAQNVEKFIDGVFNNRRNRFFKKPYRRSAFIQAEFGDAAIKTYPEGDEIRITAAENMENIMVGWNGNYCEYDFVIAEQMLTPKTIYDLYGVKVNEKQLGDIEERLKPNNQAAWENGDMWKTKGSTRPGEAVLPTGNTKMVKLKVIEYDSDDVYAIKIEGKLVQLIIKDDENYPRVKFWTIVHNIPNPPSPWSIADIDYLIDPQIEINDNDNRSSDHLRVGNVQRYVAYNMSDFDPQSINTSSGQVIFVNDPDGKSRFEPLPTNINNFPDDQYNSRKLQQMYDMGLPKVNYGASGADSGRSKAIDYQSSIDLVTFKRDAWELALADICEKIQILGNWLHPDLEMFKSPTTNEFVVRTVAFDWSDILPLSQSDKIVNISNKYNMLGLPLKEVYKELGYRNPDEVLEQLKQELSDPNLMIVRAKAWQLSSGMLAANNQAAMMAQSNNAPMEGGGANEPSATLTSSQNSESSKPMAQKGGTTAYSSAAGMIDRMRQNTQAKTG